MCLDGIGDELVSHPLLDIVKSLLYIHREGEYPTLYCPIKTHWVVMLLHTPVQGFAAKDLLIDVD